MFEERFGRRAASALVGLIGLALACLSVKTIVEILVIPSYGMVLSIVQTGLFATVRNWLLSVTKTEIFTSIAWSLVVWAFTVWYMHTIRRRALNGVKREIAANPEKYMGPIVLAAVREALATSPQASPLPTPTLPSTPAGK
jgi:hypothetical protein